MGEKIKNIKAGIAIQNNAELKLSVNGERLNDYEKFFNELYFDIIQTSLDHSNWGVWFKQIDEYAPKFIVDIYVDQQNDYLMIYRIIKDSPPPMKFELMDHYWNFQYFLNETHQP